MNKQLLIGLVITLSSRFVTGENNKTFPSDFTFGVVTAAYQVEGAWNEDGKGETIWDHVAHSNISYSNNNETGDVACDHYHRYAEDIALAASLKVQHYKFSISWSRLFPSGLANVVNLKGVTYYQDMIDQLRNSGIEPVATLYHWDLPQYLQDIGGWTNPAIIPYFVKYARTAFQYFDTLKYWVTFDEPLQICRGGYGEGTLAPLINVDGVADYLCSYVVLKAHAEVYNMYQKEFSALGGYIGIVLDVPWSEPYSDSKEDQEAAERRNQFLVGLYANPIVNGNWPEVVMNRVEERSGKENFNRSRLPQFTEEEISAIKGTFGFIGLDFYDTRYVATDDEADYDSSSFENDMRVKLYTNDSWLIGANGHTIVPWALRNTLKWLKTTYNDPMIFISENSVATTDTVDDEDRIQAIADYLDNILDAMYEDNVIVLGYTVSLLDQFEWQLGYSVHNGLFSVDFEDENLTRTAKNSVDYYRQLATTLTIPDAVTTTDSSSSTITSSPTKPGTTQESTEPTNSTDPATDATTDPSGSTTDPSGSTKGPGSSHRIQALSLFSLMMIAILARL